ncbi:MAG: hypothetical protein U1U88_000286 [Lawsonella clevelandensis]
MTHPKCRKIRFSELLQASAPPQAPPSGTPHIPPGASADSPLAADQSDPTSSNNDLPTTSQERPPHPFDEAGRMTSSLTKDSGPAPITAAAIRTDAQLLRHHLAPPTVTAAGGERERSRAVRPRLPSTGG